MTGYCVLSIHCCSLKLLDITCFTNILKVVIRDKACLQGLFREIDALIYPEFGSIVPCDIIIVTDGRINWETGFTSVSIITVCSIEHNYLLAIFANYTSLHCNQTLVNGLCYRQTKDVTVKQRAQ